MALKNIPQFAKKKYHLTILVHIKAFQTKIDCDVVHTHVVEYSRHAKELSQLEIIPIFAV
jgi:hypothetical protein